MVSQPTGDNCRQKSSACRFWGVGKLEHVNLALASCYPITSFLSGILPSSLHRTFSSCSANSFCGIGPPEIISSKGQLPWCSVELADTEGGRSYMYMHMQ